MNDISPLIETPQACLSKFDNARSVHFGGKIISLTAVHKATGLDLSWLSRVFRGERIPHIKATQAIAAAMGMTIDGWVVAMQHHERDLTNKAQTIHDQYYDRVIAEDKESINRLNKGLPPVPPLPGHRISS